MNIRIYDHSYHEIVSGGDAIAVEFGRAWLDEGHIVRIDTHPEAAAFFQSRGLSDSAIASFRYIKTDYKSVLVASFAHLVNGIIAAIRTRDTHIDFLFAGSVMLQDLLPAIITKWKHPTSRLAVGCYLFPQPPASHTYGSNWINRWAFWSAYMLGFLLARMYADVIWTASPLDAAMIKRHFHKPAIPIRGGADMILANRARVRKAYAYDAVYLGRFHPQKNILELVAIWKMVVTTLPNASLAIVGDGFLKKDIEQAITTYALQKNIHMLPSMDGQDKFDLFKSARLCVSASHHDTGNLALDEALACGTCGIVYDLPHLSYPKGVVKIKNLDPALFAKSIADLLTHPQKRLKVSQDAKRFGATLSWNLQAHIALAATKKLLW